MKKNFAQLVNSHNHKVIVNFCFNHILVATSHCIHKEFSAAPQVVAI